MDRLSNAMLSQFESQRDEYLSLLQEAEQTRGMLGRSAERLRLLRGLLALDGRSVELPAQLEGARDAPSRRRRLIT
jgi:hypothetical protein